MSINDLFTDEESAFDTAFSHLSTLCSTQCDCGRVYFVSCQGHGDYSEGELEELLGKAKAEPKKYFECHQFDRIDVDCFGFVIQCECGGSRKYIRFLENNRAAIVTYMIERYAQLQKQQTEELERTTKLNEEINRVAKLPGE